MIFLRAALWIISSVLLYFGLTEPIIALAVEPKIVIEGMIREQPVIAILLRQQGYDIQALMGLIPDTVPTEQSIVSSVQELFRLNSVIPASVILFFSIITPILKQVIFGLYFVLRGEAVRLVAGLVGAIHKWAMLDVFVLSIVIVALSSQSGWSATLLPGLYWFLGYFFTAAMMMVAFRLPADGAE